MTGRTHTAVGIAVTLAAVPPSNWKEGILTIAVASVGSVISDIDASKSKARKNVDFVLSFAVIAVIAVVLLDNIGHLGIINAIQSSQNALVSVLSIAAFLLICFIGRAMPHRSFMHSIMAVILLGACLYGIYAPIVPAFVVSMLSHLLLDCLNYKKVQLLYPAKGGVSLKLCYANGTVNSALEIIGWICIVAECFYFIVSYLR
jgi:inner membrane protein